MRIILDFNLPETEKLAAEIAVELHAQNPLPLVKDALDSYYPISVDASPLRLDGEPLDLKIIPPDGIPLRDMLLGL